MTRCPPAANNVGWGRNMPRALVESQEGALNWIDILRASPRNPSGPAEYCVLTFAKRTVLGTEVQDNEDSVETVGKLRFGSGGDKTELEFDWIPGNQVAVAGGGDVEVLARVINVNLEETTSRAIEHLSVYAAWTAVRPAIDPPIQRTTYLTLDAAATSDPIRVPPMCSSVYAAPNQATVNFGQLRVEGLSSVNGIPRSSQFEVPTPYQPIPLLGRTKFVRLTNLTANQISVALVMVYAL